MSHTSRASQGYVFVFHLDANVSDFLSLSHTHTHARAAEGQATTFLPPSYLIERLKRGKRNHGIKKS